MDRRTFIQQSMLSCLGAYLSLSAQQWTFTAKRNPIILVVSGWQDVNIGDIGHTPGLLHILESFLPQAEIILWKRSQGQEVKELLQAHFPKVKLIYGVVNPDQTVDNPEIIQAFQQADLMIHGSGPMLVGADNLASWMKFSDKPFGVFGTTLQTPNAYHQSILKKAAFIYTRETQSIEHLKKVGIEGSHIRFTPDATFYINLQNRVKAQAFLQANGLVAKKFICVIPRLRYTPYHQFTPNNNGWSADKIKQVETTNAQYKEIDHAKMREAMIAWVRETGHKILVCPEMTYQVDIMDELLIDPLPNDVKPFVVKRGYWLPDEAASVYAQAHTVLSFECHSPIIAAVNGTPCFYLRQPEDTIKGQMYYDLGFQDWVFEIDHSTGAQISAALRKVWSNYGKAKAQVRTNMHKVKKIYQEQVHSIQQQFFL